MVRLTLFAEAEKSLQKIPIRQRSKILRKFVCLEKDPYIGKKLEGELEGKYTLRAWPYRIIYLVDKGNKRVLIVSIAHRQGVYK